jgi:DNA-binding NarL/FixJ family response regulator
MKDKVQKSRQYRPLSEACQGEKNSRAKLSQKDVRVIRELLAQGMSQKRIADQFDLNQSTISNIATKKRWGHL